MNSAIKCFRHREAGYLLEIRSRIFSIASLIEKELSKKNIKGLEAIINLIDENPNITVTDLAKSINVSTRYFTKKRKPIDTSAKTVYNKREV